MGHTSAVHGAMSPCWHQPSRIPSNVSLDTLNVSFKNFFVFELQWILLVFAFWHRQKTGFEASERNKDASHAPTARKLILDALHTIRVAAFLAPASPNRVFFERAWVGSFFLYPNVSSVPGCLFWNSLDRCWLCNFLLAVLGSFRYCEVGLVIFCCLLLLNLVRLFQVVSNCFRLFSVDSGWLCSLQLFFGSSEQIQLVSFDFCFPRVSLRGCFSLFQVVFNFVLLVFGCERLRFWVVSGCLGQCTLCLVR